MSNLIRPLIQQLGPGKKNIEFPTICGILTLPMERNGNSTQTPDARNPILPPKVMDPGLIRTTPNYSGLSGPRAKYFFKRAPEYGKAAK
jgi:hypothetical protein